MENEKRLIDANALKWKIGQVRLYVASLRFGKTIISQILESYQKAVFDEIVDAPTVDAVEVVRCKDCKHSQPCGESRQCLHPYGLNVCDGKDFCSYGERRTDV